jgi:AcrR family transcriptional regulator
MTAEMHEVQIVRIAARIPRAMGLRERKKEHTRRTIEEAAFRLFAERGFQATTVADIAAAADIAPRTFFAYFPSKEHVVFGDFDQSFESLATALRDREPGVTTFDALRAWILTLVSDGAAADTHQEIRHRLIEDCEALASHEGHLLGRFEELIREAVAEDLGDQDGDLRPRLVAAAAVAALKALQPADKHEKARKPFGEDEHAQLDEAFAFLRGGIAALQDRRAGAPG